MKKILFVLLIALLVMGLIACANAREKAAENLIEEMIEKESGEKIDIDIDDGGDSITMETEEGEMTIEGDEDGMAWPSDKLPAGFPKLNGVTVTTVIDAGGGIMIGFEGCTQSAADAFISNFTAGGWKITMEAESEGTKIVMASKGDSEYVQLGWEPESGEGSITYGAN
ncbi:MAG: hypothetical protein HN389_09815 [Clostridia bacterium]|jgi:hypothetical protein|nr:hypothetical protein [Clostridia bacterium]